MWDHSAVNLLLSSPFIQERFMLYFYGKTNLLSPVEGPLTIIGNTKTRRAEVPTFLPFLCLVLHMKKTKRSLSAVS